MTKRKQTLAPKTISLSNKQHTMIWQDNDNHTEFAINERYPHILFITLSCTTNSNMIFTYYNYHNSTFLCNRDASITTNLFSRVPQTRIYGKGHTDESHQKASFVMLRVVAHTFNKRDTQDIILFA